MEIFKMTEHQGLPVAGYVAQSPENIATVNANKELEERVLRQIDAMQRSRTGQSVNDPSGDAIYDQRMIALARTKIQEGFMWLNRSVMQPKRIRLPEDN